MTHVARPVSDSFLHALGGALLTSRGVATLLLDPRLRILDASPAACRALEAEDRPLPGASLADVVEPEDHGRIARAMMEEEGEHAGPFLLRALGRVHDPDSALLVSAARVAAGEEGGHLVLVGRSAGPEVLREARVLRARRYQIVGQLTSALAHELNNRLSTVTTFADLLLGDADPGSQEAEDLVEIKRAGLDSASITRKLDLFTGGHAGSASSADPAAVLRGLEKLIHRLVPGSVEVRVEAEAGVPQVPAPPIRLEEIVFALVANARDAMPEGGVLTVRVRAVHGAQPETASGTGLAATRVLLEVSDTGEARDVPPLVRAVQPFFSSRPASVASGLGLTTVLGIVEELGGTLEMAPRPGSGTSVRVMLPAHVERPGPDEDVPAGDAWSRTEGRDAIGRTGLEGTALEDGRVALVEPDDMLRESLRRMLETRGTRVEARASIDEIANRPLPRALLADVPDEAGAAARLISEARARWPGVPLVLLRRRSVRHGPPVLDACVRELSKPLDVEHVLHALHDLTQGAPDGPTRALG